MYNLIEYSSNYSEAIGVLWIYSKVEVTSFDDNIENIDHFKSFEYQAKLLGNKFAQFTPNKGNGILKNTAIAVPLKYLRNYWRSLGLKN